MLGTQESRMAKERASAHTKPTRSAGKYTAKIIKAGALLADTKVLLAHWDTATPITDNLNRVRRENLLGKASRSRAEDVLAIFRQRYLTDLAVTKALVILVQNRFPAESINQLLYFHSAKA